MRKCVQDTSAFFLKEKYPKRFFKCDFYTAHLYIAHSEEDMTNNCDNVHKIPFADFTRVADLCSPKELEIDRDSHAKYCHGFVLTSNKRPYYLFCKSVEECDAWFTTFRYMIASTQMQVQAIQERKQIFNERVSSETRLLNASSSSLQRRPA